MTQDDILKAFGALQRRNVDGATTEEIIERSGLSKHSIQEKLRAGIKNGTMVMAGFRPGVRIDGTRKLTPVYRLVKPVQPPQKAKRKKR